MSLTPPANVRKLQDALHAKAKGSPDYRFYLLYDKVYRPDIPAFAYHCCRANGGAAGVDGQTFADIEKYGVERWLSELTQALREKTYRPQAVRRAWIPKADGGQRPLGIPTITDRVVQTAAMVVLESIFEAGLPPEQYAYRREHSALDAVKVVRALLASGHTEIVDAGLKGYFDSIPHAELMKAVARRVSDRPMLHLIKMWLKAPVREMKRCANASSPSDSDEHGGRGAPQGAPLSPLLSNLYMRRFILAWKRFGHESTLGARIVNYADDFVICCRGTAGKAMTAMRSIMQRLKLTVNEAKTHARRLMDVAQPPSAVDVAQPPSAVDVAQPPSAVDVAQPPSAVDVAQPPSAVDVAQPPSAVEERFDFLGYTFGRCYAFGSGRPYYGMFPSPQRVQRF